MMLRIHSHLIDTCDCKDTTVTTPPQSQPVVRARVVRSQQDDSGVQLAQSTSGQFHYRRVTFSSQLKSKVGNVTGNILAKSVVLWIILIIDGTPIDSKSPHTHPSHSETSRLLTSSLSLGIPVPRTT
jgi:hypothetical protein